MYLVDLEEQIATLCLQLHYFSAGCSTSDSLANVSAGSTGGAGPLVSTRVALLLNGVSRSILIVCCLRAEGRLVRSVSTLEGW